MNIAISTYIPIPPHQDNKTKQKVIRNKSEEIILPNFREFRKPPKLKKVRSCGTGLFYENTIWKWKKLFTCLHCKYITRSRYCTVIVVKAVIFVVYGFIFVIYLVLAAQILTE